jgi:solute carrier family 35 (GDP-fucose transporter), member C1
LKGTLAGVLSSLFVSLNSIFTKSVLAAVDNDHWKLTFYNNVNASIMFVPLMLIFEHGPIAAGFSQQFHSGTFWAAMLVAGFFGFSIGIVTVLQIKATSPLTHNVSGTAKAAVQSMMAFYIWGNKATFMGVLGIFVVLGGSLFYTYVKMDEGKTTTKKQALAASEDKDVEVNRPLKSGVN